MRFLLRGACVALVVFLCAVRFVESVVPPPEAAGIVEAWEKANGGGDSSSLRLGARLTSSSSSSSSVAAAASEEDTEGERKGGEREAEQKLPSCALHLYRHASKTGGTTIRFVWDKNVVMGDWEYPIIYGFTEQQWMNLLERWKEAAKKWKGGEREVGPRTLVEVRGNWPSNWSAQHFSTRIVPDVDALKREFGGEDFGCEVTTSVLIREPTSQTLSFYEYYIRKQQNQDPGSVKKMWPGIVGKESWGYDIGDYVSSGRATNGQVREILGDKCTNVLREPGYETKWDDETNKPVRTHPRPIGQECEITEEDYKRFENLLKWFDIVGTTEYFDHFLLVQSRAAGVRYPQYKKSNSGKHSREWDPKDLEKVKNATALDARAHELASSLQREKATRFFGSWEILENEHVLPFREKTVDGFVGGKPPKSLYKWVKTSEAMAIDATPVVLDCWTEDTGGG